MFLRLSLLALALACSHQSSLAISGKSGFEKGGKVLPLDGMPDAFLKTRLNSEYLPGRLILKLIPGADISSLADALGSLFPTSVEIAFPEAMIRAQKGDVDLSRFYIVSYTAPVDAFTAAEDLSALPGVQYAEPWFVYPLEGTDLFIPNDPSFSSQYGLTKIQAPAAWDVTQGDTTVVIGIVDTGIELAHPDLAANIWHNPGEMGLDGSSNDKRTNGIDDDANGYIDDWRGWDFGGADYNNVVPDNNPVPTASNNAHGSHVGGIASAATNNNLGVAGTGFRCRLLPVKTSADNDFRGPGGTAYIIAGIQGIAYAGHMGADVMNCSWGGSGGSQFEQDIINYATQQGTLVVAAAGNSGANMLHFPSSYANVISVASTNSSDVRSSFSNYGVTVDVCAPGSGILSTVFQSTYATWDGTSMSSPFVAGTAALVKSVYPSYTALQVGEKVRVTCDNIDAQNPAYVGLLGKGRINANRAVTQSSPSLRAFNFVVRDSSGGNNNGNPEPNEVIDLFCTFINYLAPSANAQVVLTETSAYLTVVNGTYTIGGLATLDTIRNLASPFRIQIAGNVPPGHVSDIKLTVTDGTYNDFQWFTLVINPAFQTHNVNNVTVTMTNNGRIGFNDFSTNTQGVGFIYPAGGVNHLFEGGLIIGTSSTKLVNNVRNPGGTQDNDMLSRQIYQLQTPGIISNQDGSTIFSDSSAPVTNRIGLLVNQYTYAFSAPDHDDYVIVRYDVKNISATAVSNLYVGQFFDWDIANYATNHTSYDAARSLAYAWDANTPTAPYIGTRALDSAASCRGLVNTTGIVLDRAAKWGWISGGTSQANAGPQDIHTVISSGPFLLAPGSTRMVGFALIGGTNLADLQTNADLARVKWNEIVSLLPVRGEEVDVPAEFALKQNYPNPFNPKTVVRYEVAVKSAVRLVVYDVLGREVARLAEGIQDAGVRSVEWDASGIPSGVYFYRLRAGDFTETKKMVLAK
jgi:subtilisin family serine protease